MTNQTCIIVDDHPAIRMTVRLLMDEINVKTVGESCNGVDALKMARALKPGIIILDIGIPLIDGLQVTSRLINEDPEIKVLIITSQPTQSFSSRCLQAGACGFISKNDDLMEIKNAVGAIFSGYVYFPKIIKNTNKNSLLSENELIEKLTNREITIFQMLSKGMSNKGIADILLLSNKTISTYKARIYAKLNISSIVELVDFAKRNNMI